jgi:iron complex transport system substrate-binding protein
MVHMARVAIVAVALVTMAGCGRSELVSDLSRRSDTPGDGEFPRTVDVEGRSISLATKPRRIAILSPSIGEAAYKLIDHSRIAAASTTLENERLSNVAALARRTPTKLPGGFQMDPEQVLALDPDLVLVEPSHDAERDAEKILAQAGIPVVDLPRWNSVASIRQNFLTLGKVLAAEQNAAHIVARMDARLEDVRRAVAPVQERAVVLALSGFATPLVNGRGTVTHDLIAHAGAVNATDIMRTGPWDTADVEKIIAADPDYIALIDLHGTGRDAFASILGHPGMRVVTAMRRNQIKVFLPRHMMSVGTDQVIDGLVDLARWIYPEQFTRRSERRKRDHVD